jgi:hypothetical protein
MNRDSQNAATVVMGITLVGLGLFFLVAQFLRLSLWSLGWPFFVIIPGLMFFVGMIASGKDKNGGLAIPGCIVTTTGLILLYQNVFHTWATWTYVWALIFPTAVGLGLIIEGLWDDHPHSVREGRQMMLVGLIIFVMAAVFFEVIIGIGGGGLSSYFWSLALIAVGVYLLLKRAILAPSSRNASAGGPTEPPRGKED